MDQTGLAPAGSFCWNPECPDYAQMGHHNMRKFGRAARGVRRYQCKPCKKTYAETKGTVFHGCHHSQKTILECLARLLDRNSLAAIQGTVDHGGHSYRYQHRIGRLPGFAWGGYAIIRCC